MSTKFRRAITASTILIATAAPSAATARFELNPEPAVAPQSSAGTPPSAQPSGGSGFQWDDAAIGAAGAVALLGTAGGASVLARRRREGALRRNAIVS